MKTLNKKFFTHYSLLITHYSRLRRVGFTLIEILLTMGIFSLLIYLASSSLMKIQKSRLLNDKLWQTASIIRETQSRAVSGEATESSHFRFGVLFDQDFYQEFATLSDFAGRLQIYDLINDLPSSLRFVDFNLPDNCLQPNDCIIFSAIEGTPSANGSISLENQVDKEKKTIYINQQGKVNF